jgi:hypothetical protein
MPHFPFKYSDPTPEIWGAVHFPQMDVKTSEARDAFIADLRTGYFPGYFWGSNPSPIFEVAGASRKNRPELFEIHRRQEHGSIAGELLKLVFAIAGTDETRASWNAAIDLLRSEVDFSVTTIRSSKERFASVAHFWCAWSLRGRHFHNDPALSYTAEDDLSVFICEAMTVLNWATNFVLCNSDGMPRAKAKSLLRKDLDFWTPDPRWNPIRPGPRWPRFGGVSAPTLTEKQQLFLGTLPVNVGD